MTSPAAGTRPPPPGAAAVPRTSELLDRLAADGRGADVTFHEIAAGLRERAYGLLLLVLGVFGWVPIYPPGVASLFGIGMVVVAWQMLAGRDEPWLPRRVQRIGIGRGRFRKLVDRLLPWLRRFETFARPRFLGLTAGFRERALGACVLLLGLVVIVPLPMTNAGPSLGVAVIAIGLMERDGVIVVLGVAVGILSIVAMLAFWAGALAGLYLLLH